MHRFLPTALALVTALAYGNANTQFWVGTNKGEIYVDLHNGADNFPLRSSGLPKSQVNSIFVDPRSDTTGVCRPGGSAGHVFMTIDGGNSGRTFPRICPMCRPNSIVVDLARAQAPNGIIMGTNTGVYFSNNKGVSWSRLGNVRNSDGTISQSLPNAPVVNMQLSTQYNELAIATKGRGAFMISINTSGPAVIGVTPATPVNPGLSSVVVTFNEPIDPRTFTVGQILQLQGPNGPITPLSVKDLDVVNHDTYQINFLPQSQDGTYTMTLGTGIKDFTGLALDQNQNGYQASRPWTISRRISRSTAPTTADCDRGLQRHSWPPRRHNRVPEFPGPSTRRFGLLPGQALSIITSDEAREFQFQAVPCQLPGSDHYYPALCRIASPQRGQLLGGPVEGRASAQQVLAMIAAPEYYALPVGSVDDQFVTQIRAIFSTALPIQPA